MPPPILVQTPADWQDCLSDLARQPQLAVDMESNSLHAYREQVCLIQISTPHQDYIVDPLALPNLDGLGEVMADPAVEKIFHAAEYDLLSIKRDFGFAFYNLFDTMLAARTLGWKKLGLASLLQEEFGVELDKRFQRTNWARRPLTPEQIAYARLDTHFLFDLRDRLQAELVVAGRLIEARESFERIAQVTPTLRTFCPDDFWQLLNGRYRLSPQQHAVLRELYIFRESEAQRRDQPPFKIFADRTLLQLAESLPHFPDELQGIYGLTPKIINRYGRRVLQIIRQGMNAQLPSPPPECSRPPEAVQARYEALHNWRKERARQRGVELDVIVCRDALWNLARLDPKTVEDLGSIQSLGDWQQAHYGREMIQVLNEMRNSK